MDDRDASTISYLMRDIALAHSAQWKAEAERDRLKAKFAEAVSVLETQFQGCVSPNADTPCLEKDMGYCSGCQVKDFLARHKPKCGTCGDRGEVIPPNKSVNQLAAGAAMSPCPDCAGGDA